MIVRMGRHYDITKQGRGSAERITNLYCLLCPDQKNRFSVWRSEVVQGTSRSGLGKFNRMRAKMVKHLHANHVLAEIAD